MARLSKIIWIGLKCNHKYPFEKEAEGDYSQKMKSQCDHLREIGVMQPQSKNVGAIRWWKRQGMDFPPGPLQGVMALLAA